MEFNGDEILRATMVLFAVIDVIGSIPVIINIKKKAGEIHPLRASLVAFGIMVGFLFIGEQILGLFHVTVNEFAVAGAFILFFMALEMILGIKLFRDESAESPKIASVVPLAFPILAGAGTMTSLVALRAEYDTANILVAVVINVLLIFVVLKLTRRIENFLGPNGIAVLQKVFGIILLAIAIKLFSTNIQALVN